MGGERAFDRERVRPLLLTVRAVFVGGHQGGEGREQRPRQRRRLQAFAETELPHGERYLSAGVGVAHRHVPIREQHRELFDRIHHAACPSM